MQSVAFVPKSEFGMNQWVCYLFGQVNLGRRVFEKCVGVAKIWRPNATRLDP
jgi:hypothetical protein